MKGCRRPVPPAGAGVRRAPGGHRHPPAPPAPPAPVGRSVGRSWSLPAPHGTARCGSRGCGVFWRLPAVRTVPGAGGRCCWWSGAGWWRGAWCARPGVRHGAPRHGRARRPAGWGSCPGSGRPAGAGCCPVVAGLPGVLRGAGLRCGARGLPAGGPRAAVAGRPGGRALGVRRRGARGPGAVCPVLSPAAPLCVRRPSFLSSACGPAVFRPVSGVRRRCVPAGRMQGAVCRCVRPFLLFPAGRRVWRVWGFPLVFSVR